MATKVKMENSSLGVMEFDIDHAERIMAYQAKYKLTDWELSDSNFTIENGVITRRNKSAAGKTEKHIGDSKGN